MKRALCGAAALCALCGFLAAAPRFPDGLRILDRGGAPLAVLPAADGAYVEPLSPEEMPALCRTLFVRLEDRRFFVHPGVDPAALLRAGAGQVLFRLSGGRTGRTGGGSTITMQLARLRSPHPRTVAGKLREIGDALLLEATLSKQAILTRYLNAVPFGYNVRGVGAAARTYFDTDLAALGEAQLLVLALVPRNPFRFDPLAHPDAVIGEASAVSARLGLGIGLGEIEAAVRSARRGGPPQGRAPHFTRFLVSHIPVAQEAGAVRTTLDASLNDFVQGRIRRYLDAYRQARITNAACVVIENSTGAVRAWVGSRDFLDSASSGQIDGVLIRRQTASVIKPFLYGYALSQGWTPASLLPDAPLDFGQQETYRPVNFDGKSHGAVRLRTALGSSLNVPAVYMLSRLGVASWMSHLRQLGFELPPDAASRYGLGAAVGNIEVSLLELVRAFSAFPRGGTLPELVFLEDGGAGAAGRGAGSLAVQKRSGARVYDPGTAWLVVSMLSDPSARSTGFGTRTYFRTSFPAMFKSGTSSEFTNLWCLGATPAYTVGVWAGNFDGRAVINKTGSIVPAQIVVDTLKRLSAAPGDFTRPAGVVAARICALTGRGATDRCPSARTEYFRTPQDVPPPCTYHTSGAGREELLPESILAEGPRPVILHPLEGQLFFFDETLQGAVQRIPVLIGVPRGERISVSLDGGPETEASGRFTIPARRGRHSILVRCPGGRSSVSFEVR